MNTQKKKRSSQEYGMVQIPREAYIELKDFCSKNGLLMGQLVAKLIRKELKVKTDAPNY
jgi:hypothetical protein